LDDLFRVHRWRAASRDPASRKTMLRPAVRVAPKRGRRARRPSPATTGYRRPRAPCAAPAGPARGLAGPTDRAAGPGSAASAAWPICGRACRRVQSWTPHLDTTLTVFSSSAEKTVPFREPSCRKFRITDTRRVGTEVRGLRWVDNPPRFPIGWPMRILHSRAAGAYCFNSFDESLLFKDRFLWEGGQ